MEVLDDEETSILLGSSIHRLQDAQLDRLEQMSELSEKCLQVVNFLCWYQENEVYQDPPIFLNRFFLVLKQNDSFFNNNLLLKNLFLVKYLRKKTLVISIWFFSIQNFCWIIYWNKLISYFSSKDSKQWLFTSTNFFFNLMFIHNFLLNKLMLTLTF